MSTPVFDNAAIGMFRYAGFKPSVNDVKLLADDLIAVADEFNEHLDEEYDATHAVNVLRQRIGGYKNLESYMKCLRVPNRADDGRPDLSHDADCTYRMGHAAPCSCGKDSR